MPLGDSVIARLDCNFFTYFGAFSLKRMRRFDLLTTDLDHALVVCDLTQIPTEGSGCRWGASAAFCPLAFCPSAFFPPAFCPSAFFPPQAAILPPVDCNWSWSSSLHHILHANQFNIRTVAIWRVSGVSQFTGCTNKAHIA